MKIYYDNIVYYLQRAGGISVYWTELASRLLRSHHEVTFVERADKPDNLFRDKLNNTARHIVREPALPLSLVRYLPVKADIAAPALFHSSYYRICRKKHVANIVSVYDFTYEHFFTGIRRMVHTRQKRYALKNADGIICISESTKKDLLQFYGWIDEKKVRVIYLGIGDQYAPLKKDVEPDCSFRDLLRIKYVLYVGARVAHKNFSMAISALSHLPDLALVIVGGGPLSDAEAKMLNSRLKGRYRYLPDVNDRDLNILYNYAHCLLYPSRYEGFGIPLAEAMKAGCPVVTTNVSSIPEVVGDAGLMVDFIDEYAFVEKIKSLENPAIRVKSTDMGHVQARKFSWDTCFAETVHFYDEVYERMVVMSERSKA